MNLVDAALEAFLPVGNRKRDEERLRRVLMDPDVGCSEQVARMLTDAHLDTLYVNERVVSSPHQHGMPATVENLELAEIRAMGTDEQDPERPYCVVASVSVEGFGRQRHQRDVLRVIAREMYLQFGTRAHIVVKGRPYHFDPVLDDGNPPPGYKHQAPPEYGDDASAFEDRFVADNADSAFEHMSDD